MDPPLAPILWGSIRAQIMVYLNWPNRGTRAAAQRGYKVELLCPYESHVSHGFAQQLAESALPVDVGLRMCF